MSPSFPTPPDPNRFADAHALNDSLPEIGRSLIASIDQTTPLYTDSPPEAILGALLRSCYRDFTESGELTISVREPVALPSTAAQNVELDLILRRPQSDATCAIEIDSHEWHRRSVEEHEHEIRRDREVRRHIPYTVRYAAREVLRDPWAIILDLDGHLAGWAGWETVHLSPSMRALVEACAQPTTSCTLETAQLQLPRSERCPRRVLERLHELSARLPISLPSSNSKMRALRCTHPRAYEPWHLEEEQALRDAYSSWIDMEDIATALGRTRRAVWRHVYRLGLIPDRVRPERGVDRRN